MEIWKPVKGFELMYEVSNMGNVRSLLDSNHNPRRQPKNITQWTIKSGYRQVNLWVNKRNIHKLVHRLVAEAFIPNPESLPQVNHKDEDKLNNAVCNLEWCDSGYNCNYGDRNAKISRATKGMRRFDLASISKPVIASRGGYQIRFDSIAEAGRYFGNRNGINNCLCGRSKTACGYSWRYA